MFIAGLLLGALVLAAATPRIAEAEDDPVQIATAPDLNWGFKLSWRVYAGQPTVAGGAEVVADTAAAGYNLGWDFDSGSYDAANGITVLSYHGSARWTSHGSVEGGFEPPPGYEGPANIDLLDLTLADPTITISRDVATITAEVKSRSLSTWQIVDYGRIPIVDLAADQVTPTVASGTTSWPAIPATINAAASAPFGDSYYQPGIGVDPVAFSYEGPGGAPDFSENFDPEGMIKLEADGANDLILPADTPIGDYSMWAADPVRQIAYYRTVASVDGNQGWSYQAYDLEGMEKLGAPLLTPIGVGLNILLHDTTSGKIYVDTETNAYPQHWLRYDEGAGGIVEGDDPAAIPTSRDNMRISWDPVGERAFEVVRAYPDGSIPSPEAEDFEFDAQQWQLRTYTRQPDDSWSLQRYDLPNGPPGLNGSRYQPQGVAASDGSLILLGEQQYVWPELEGVTAPDTVPAAYRVVTQADGSAVTTPIAGSETANDGALSFFGGAAGPNGVVALVDRQTSAVRRIDVTPPGGGPIVADPLVENPFAGVAFSPSVAIDSEDGTVWMGARKSRKIVGVRDGRVVADQTFALRSTRATAVIGLPGGKLVMQSNDGAEDNLLTSAFGFQKLRRVGVTASIDADPADRSASLGAGEESEEVSFSAAATGTPVPTVQWQLKAPGSTRFGDVAGATAGTLTVAAKRGMDGSQYRAVFTNAAGRVASEAATLAVDYAPRIGFDLADVSTFEGEDAEFEILHDGNPDPTISWQRRVAGFWQAIGSGDGDFIVDGPSLTVLDANQQMSGTLFRAKLTNSVGTVYSRAAELTVKSAVGEPVSFGSGSFEWGFANRWRCYVVGSVAHGGIEVSGGVTPVAGATASGALCPGAGAGSEALSFPVRGGHYDPADGSLEVKLNGSVRFWGHVSGGKPALDTTFSDLKLIAEGETGTLYADATGPTMADPTVVTRQDVPLVTVDLTGSGPTPAGESGLDWSGATTELTAQGAEVFGAYPEGEPFDPIAMALTFGTPQPDPEPETGPDPEPKPGDKPALPSPLPAPAAKGPAAGITPAKRRQELRGRRSVELGSLRCPSATPCRVVAPKHVGMELGGKRFVLDVLAPKWLAAGGEGSVRVRLPKRAAARLGGLEATIAVTVAAYGEGGESKRTLKVVVWG